MTNEKFNMAAYRCGYLRGLLELTARGEPLEDKHWAWVRQHFPGVLIGSSTIDCLQKLHDRANAVMTAYRLTR